MTIKKEGRDAANVASPGTTNIDAYKDFAAEAQVKSEIDYPTLAALRGDEVGPLDHICPLCSAEGDQRLKLRTWDVSPGMISFYCVRCGASGYARATLDQLLHPERYEAETSAVIVRVKPKRRRKPICILSGGSGMRQRRSCRGACLVFPLARHPHRRGTTRGAALSSEVPLARQARRLPRRPLHRSGDRRAERPVAAPRQPDQADDTRDRAAAA